VTVEQDNTFVLFPMGEKRFAFPAAEVEELARPDQLQTFPHGTPLLAGVLVRRGKIVPVLDIAQLLVGPQAPPRKFYLITNRKLDSRHECTAIPVTGECELASLPPAPANGSQKKYVTGLLMAGEEPVEIVNLEKLIAEEEKL
jgi:chemotaxis signal transduction protein